MKEDWITETDSGDRTVFKVRQRKYDMARNCGISLVAATVIGVIGSSLQGGGAGGTVFGIVLVLIAALLGFVGLLLLAVSAIVMMATSRHILLGVSDTGIARLNANETVKEEYTYPEIANLYATMTNREVTTVEQTRYTGLNFQGASVAAAANVGAAAGGMFLALSTLIAGQNALVSLNYKGREKVLAKRLSDEEATYLFERILAAADLKQT